jgi:hypothetical protein
VPTALPGGISTSGFPCPWLLCCRGRADIGTLGSGRFGLDATPVPQPVWGGRSYKMISCDHAHVCAVDLVGDAWCWGQGSGSQMLMGTNLTGCAGGSEGIRAC